MVLDSHSMALRGLISPIEAIRMWDKALGGIVDTNYKTDKTFTIGNDDFRVGIPYRVRRKQKGILEAEAVLAYHGAKENGSMFPGGVHIGKHASTKHHMGGIDAILRKQLNGNTHVLN